MKCTLFTIALASTASAALQARDVSTVVADLGTIGTNLQTLTDALNAYKGDIGTAVAVQQAEPALDTSIKQATSDVGTDAASEADSNTILSAVNSLLPNVITALNTFVDKQASFKSIGLGQVASNDIMQLSSDTQDLAAALVAVADPAVGAQATSASACIVSAFSSAIAGSSVSSCVGPAATTSSSDSSPTDSSSSSSPEPTGMSTTSTGSSTPTSTTSSSTPSATGNAAIKNAGGIMGAAAAAAFALVL